MRGCALLLLGFAGALSPAIGQTDCPTAHLPAYSHNDYANPHPLRDALSLGFRGVEADVFLIDDSLRVGHDRRAASRGGTLQALYIEPLRDLLARCGALGAPERPFLFTIEMKQPTPAARLALSGLLARVESSSWSNILLVILPDGDPRLVSVDYGKHLGRWWISDSQRTQRLQAIRAKKSTSLGVLLRAHNVPVNSRVYRELLDAGIDLIGSKDLTATRRLLSEP